MIACGLHASPDARAQASAPAEISENHSSAQLPQLGDSSDLSLQAERKLGDRIAREIYRDPDYVDDPVIMDYVQTIWQKLLAAARVRGDITPELAQRYAWEIMLGRDRSVNAFALPGGYMGLHLGLIGVVANRNELASVLAHELSHITQRHISRLISRQSQQAPWLIGAMILGMLAAGKSVDGANALIVGGQAVSAQNQLNFSRDMEREADRIGLAVLTQAGFDPQGFVTMFDKLQQASRLNDNSSYPYLRSHPLTTERIADMQSRLPVITDPGTPPPPSMEHAMVAARARVLSQSASESAQTWQTQDSLPGFIALEAPRQAAILYASALNAIRLRDFAQAHTALVKLRALVHGDAPAQRLHRLLELELLLSEGEAQRAYALMQHPLPANAGVIGPQGRAEQLALASSAIDANHAQDAAQQLRTWLAEHPHDALAWQLLSRAYTSTSQTLSAIRADAESRVAVLDDQAAIDRFKAAQNYVAQHKSTLSAADHIEASIIDTRLHQLESLSKEQAAER